MCYRVKWVWWVSAAASYAITYARLAPSLVNTTEQVDAAVRAVREISG